jgi:hypothetical protein
MISRFENPVLVKRVLPVIDLPQYFHLPPLGGFKQKRPFVEDILTTHPNGAEG